VALPLRALVVFIKRFAGKDSIFLCNGMKRCRCHSHRKNDWNTAIRVAPFFDSLKAKCQSFTKCEIMPAKIDKKARNLVVGK
jgi:hypothetical protein